MKLFALGMAVLALFSPLAAHAESPFNGTWKIDPATIRWSGVAAAFLLKDGAWYCVGCSGIPPTLADGRPHPYSGAPDVEDSLRVRVLDAHKVQIEGLNRGRLFTRRTLTVSADGATLTNDIEVAPLAPGAPPVTRRVVLQRISPGPPGSHLISGTWRPAGMKTMSDDVATSIFRVEGDRVDWSTPAGVAYHAVFDGPPTPQIGDPDHIQITVRRINDHEIVESDWKAGKVEHVFTFTVSADGRSMTIVDQNAETGSVQTETAYKQ